MIKKNRTHIFKFNQQLHTADIKNIILNLKKKQSYISGPTYKLLIFAFILLQNDKLLTFSKKVSIIIEKISASLNFFLESYQRLMAVAFYSLELDIPALQCDLHLLKIVQDIHSHSVNPLEHESRPILSSFIELYIFLGPAPPV